MRFLAHAIRGELPGGLKLEKRPVHKLVASLDQESSEYRDLVRSAGAHRAVVNGGLVEPILLAAGTEHVLEGVARILWAESRALSSLPVVLLDVPEEREAELGLQLRQLRARNISFDPERISRLARDIRARAYAAMERVR